MPAGCLLAFTYENINVKWNVNHRGGDGSYSLGCSERLNSHSHRERRQAEMEMTHFYCGSGGQDINPHIRLRARMNTHSYTPSQHTHMCTSAWANAFISHIKLVASHYSAPHTYCAHRAYTIYSSLCLVFLCNWTITRAFISIMVLQCVHGCTSTLLDLKLPPSLSVNLSSKYFCKMVSWMWCYIFYGRKALDALTSVGRMI